MVEVVKGKATDKYDVGEVIGRGKFSTVKLCTDKSSGREYAVKILRTARRGCSRDAILNEVRIMNMCVECTYVLKLVEVFDGGREFHLVEELAEFGDLYSTCLAEENHAEEHEVRHYIKQLLAALVFIHDRNIVHCDIKPENVLVTRDETDNIRLVDFGLARVVSPKDKVCEIVGTTEYVAPEILSFEPITAACDMWSLGVLAYTLLSGISPFLGDNDSETYANISHCDYDFDDEVFDSVSEEAQHFISDLLEVKPRIRPGCHEMSTNPWMTSDQTLPSGLSGSSTSVGSQSQHTTASPAISNHNTIAWNVSVKLTPATHGEATCNESVNPLKSSRSSSITDIDASSHPPLTPQRSVLEKTTSLPLSELSPVLKEEWAKQITPPTPEDNEGGDNMEDPPLSAGALRRRRRSQSCRSLPATVLIDRPDPEESFTFLQEQAVRLADKIEAMLAAQSRRRSQNSIGNAMCPEAPHSTPLKEQTEDRVQSSPDSSLEDMAHLSSSFCKSPNDPHRPSDGAQLLNKVRVHLKSSASISGMRQLEHPRMACADGECGDHIGSNALDHGVFRVHSVDRFGRLAKLREATSGESNPEDDHETRGITVAFSHPFLPSGRNSFSKDNFCTPDPSVLGKVSEAADLRELTINEEGAADTAAFISSGSSQPSTTSANTTLTSPTPCSTSTG